MDAPVAGSTTVSVIGLGNMGVPIAERILEARFRLSVYNRHPDKAAPLVERGATLLASAAEGLRASEVCLTVLADDAALEAVVLGEAGVLAGARAGTVLVDMSTVSVDVSERVAERAADAGVGYLRAPMSGNPTVVRGGALTIIVSGPKEVAARVEPLLRAIGPTVLYLGEGEHARVVKLVLQTLIGGTAELLSEAVVLGEAAGVDRAKVLEAVGASVVGSRFVEYKTAQLLEDDYAATFTTSLMLKDVDLMLDLAAQTDTRLPFTEQLRGLLDAAVDGGYGDHDFIALYLLLRDERAHQTPTRSR